MTTEDIFIRQRFQADGLDSAVSAFDEVNARVENALSTMVEFGASSDDVAAGFRLLGRASDSGSRGIAQTANVLRTLTDASQDAEASVRSVGAAFELAERAGVAAEDAGTQYGNMLRGETQILQNFDQRARDAAGAIDEITDPQLRAAATADAYRQALNRQNSVLGRATDRLRAFAATHPNIVQGFKLAAAGAATLTAAIGGGLVASVRTYMQGSAAMRRDTKKLDDAFKDLLFQIGGIVTKTLKLDVAQRGLARAIREVSRWVEDNRGRIASWVQDAVKGATYVVQVVGNIGLGIAMLSSLVVEGISEMVRKAFGTMGDLLIQLSGTMNDLGLVTLETSQDLAALGRTMRDGGKADVSFPITERLVELQQQLNDTAAAARDAFSGPINLDAISKRGLGPRTAPGSKKRNLEAGAIFTTGAPASNLTGALGAIGLPTTEGTDLFTEIGRSQISAASPFIGRESFENTEELERARATLKSLQTTNEQLKDPQVEIAIKQIDTAVKNTDRSVQSLARSMGNLAEGGIMAVTDSIGSMVEAFAAGENGFKALGKTLVASFGQLLSQAGRSFLLMGLGVSSIASGIPNPAALIGIGAAAIALGGALKGFSARMEGRGGGGSDNAGVIAALDRIGRRVIERPDREGREVSISIDGRPFRGYVEDIASDGIRRGSIAPLTPRRALG